MKEYSKRGLEVLKKIQERAKNGDFNIEVIRKNFGNYVNGILKVWEVDCHDYFQLNIRVDCDTSAFEIDSVEELSELIIGLDNIRQVNPELFESGYIRVGAVEGKLYYMDNPSNEGISLYEMIDCVSKNDIDAFEVADKYHRDWYGQGIDDEVACECDVLAYIDNISIRDEFKNISVERKILELVDNMLSVTHSEVYMVLATINGENKDLIEEFTEAEFNMNKSSQNRYFAFKICD